MNTARWLAFVLALVIASTAASADPESSLQASSRPAPLELVQTAFDRMFNYPSVRSITLRVFRNGRQVSYRSFDVAYDRLGEQGHTVLRFTGPEYLRDNALLIIEKEDGRNDSWLYQPGEQRMRRVGTQQKGDAFYGSDLSFEDLEHHAWSRFQPHALPDVVLEGAPTYVLEAKPPNDSQYGLLRIYIEKRRVALRRVDFFRRGSEELTKQMLIPADHIEEVDGHLVAREFQILQHGRDARTVVEITRVEVDPGLTKKAFSLLRLQQGRGDLFELVRRQSGSDAH